ncbi:ABC transporter permease [Phytomonospora endophytica]|uniref:Peptide/nickel transport system permease protein n=1 Tax=Phytomonospora endophytica TaxID=714109 RepID=A0A841FKT1_9ACTN|nr:ABC transporter permease [Phytomonospora endophytica]MBB6033249.1 peptide/nickel transport system permease protein [Phytomonospora endophytica]GIG65475.1 peptide ABC transporter permease [Phytomonospora endophytica]
MTGMIEPITDPGSIEPEVVVTETVDGKQQSVHGRSPGQMAWIRLKRDRTARVTGALILGILLAAYGVPLWTAIYGTDAYAHNPDLLDRSSVPLGFVGVSGSHWLGILQGNGEDVLMQLLTGMRTSLTISIICAILATAIGAIIGATAGFLGGWVDAVINWIIDVMLSLPFLIVALAAFPIMQEVFFGGPSERPLILSGLMVTGILLIFGWVGTARLTRGQVISLREREFIEAARASGAGNWHIIFKQILPNVWAPILVSFSMAVPGFVGFQAYLAFLNIGVGHPHPDLGRLVNFAVGKMQGLNGWFLLVISGGTIFLLVLTFNLFGDAVRDALNPKSNR